jgi:hypothetical protein
MRRLPMEYLKTYQSKTGGSVYLHPLHGADELLYNSEAALVLADHGHVVELLPTIVAADTAGRQKWLPDIVGSKNPDVRIDGCIIGDIKTPNRAIPIKQSTINRCIYACAQQKVSLAIINLLDRRYTIQDIKKGIIGALQPDRNKSIQQTWVLTARKNVFKVKRRMVFDESIYNQLILL